MFVGNVIANGPLRGPEEGQARSQLAWPRLGCCDVALPGTWWGECPALQFTGTVPWPGPLAGEPSSSDLPMTLGLSGLSSFVGNGRVGERAL